MKHLQLRRYSNNIISTITGVDGEVIIDKTNKTLTVHDGIFPGGSRLATEQFVLNNNGGSVSTYGDSNVASFLPNYGGHVSTTMITGIDDYINIVSNIGFQLQYDPSQVFNEYDVANGSWLYFDATGLFWQSNVTGNIHTLTFGNDGTITFEDQTVQNTAFTGTGNIGFLNNKIVNNISQDLPLMLMPGGTGGGAGEAFVYLPGNADAATLPISIRNMVGNVVIGTNSSTSWQFNAADQSLSIPTGWNYLGSSKLSAPDGYAILNGSNGAEISVGNELGWIGIEDGFGYIHAQSSSGPSAEWNFAANGTLTLPNGSSIAMSNVQEISDASNTVATFSDWQNVQLGGIDQYTLANTPSGVTTFAEVVIDNSDVANQWITWLNTAFDIQNSPNNETLLIVPAISIALRNALKSTWQEMHDAYLASETATDSVNVNAGNVQFKLGSDGNIHWPDGTFQNTAFKGYATDNTARTLAQAAYDAANADLLLLSTELTSNASFISAINSSQNTQIGAAFSQANVASNNTIIAGSYANSAYVKANSAYALAANVISMNVDNTSIILTSGGQAQINPNYPVWLYQQSNSGGYAAFKAFGYNSDWIEMAVSSVANNNALWSVQNGNLNLAPFAIYSNNLTIAVANTNGTTSQNNFVFTANGLLYPDKTTQNTAFLGYAIDTYARTTANAALTSSNGTIIGSYANSAFVVANNALTSSNGTIIGSYANSAFVVANSALTSSNGTIIASYANSAFAVANAALTAANGVIVGSYANSAYALANIDANNIVIVGSYANSAYTKANSSIQTTGGSINGMLNVVFQPSSTINSAIQISAANTIGGIGYADAIKITNSSGSATNPNKTIRLNPTGGIEIIDNNYGNTIFQIQDNGDTTLKGNLTINGINAGYAPNRPAFRVIGNGGVINSGNTVTSSNWTVDFNQGNYLASNGIFTAPLTGLYQVNVVVRTQSNNNAGINQIIVRKTTSTGNNTTAAIMVEFGPNTSMNHAGGSTILKMSVGDTLKFDVTGGSISFDGNDNWSVAYIG